MTLKRIINEDEMHRLKEKINKKDFQLLESKTKIDGKKVRIIKMVNKNKRLRVNHNTMQQKQQGEQVEEP